MTTLSKILHVRVKAEHSFLRLIYSKGEKHQYIFGMVRVEKLERSCFAKSVHFTEYYTVLIGVA